MRPTLPKQTLIHLMRTVALAAAYNLDLRAVFSTLIIGASIKKKGLLFARIAKIVFIFNVMAPEPFAANAIKPSFWSALNFLSKTLTAVGRKVPAIGRTAAPLIVA